MKKLKKTEQRKLYEMFEHAVTTNIGLQIQVEYDFGRVPDELALRNEATEKKIEFLSFLEEGIN
jgi:hypothetical protein